MHLTKRPRRNRKSPVIRELVSETSLSVSQLVYPLFFKQGLNSAEEISSMPGQSRHSVESGLRLIEEAMNLGVCSFALFPASPDSLKNSLASEALNPSGYLPTLVREIKKRFPESCIITDVALDPYSSDGHDGLVVQGSVVNDPTVEVLARMALIQAEAGADIVAPSDMMDGRVGAIRSALDAGGFSNTGIMAYSAKFASNYYGPFRDALDSAPKFGDKKTYQMDYRNRLEALREVRLDIEEGADSVMVKPALSYLDIIREIKNISEVPVAAYNVSGEYSMLKLSARAGFLHEDKAVEELLYSIRRAGADIILTYFALDYARRVKGI